MRYLVLVAGLVLALGGPVRSDFRDGALAVEHGDYATAFQEWLPLAEAGDVSAQYNLGIMYTEGHGVARNYAEAVKWYRRAAKQGHGGAQNNLGFMYKDGQGVAQNYAEAANWWRMAAEQGVAFAQTGLGFLYEVGRGVPQDYVQAHMWSNLGGINGSEKGAMNRGRIATQMTRAQIAEAQRLARQCMAMNYKGC